MPSRAEEQEDGNGHNAVRTALQGSTGCEAAWPEPLCDPVVLGSAVLLGQFSSARIQCTLWVKSLIPNVEAEDEAQQLPTQTPANRQGREGFALFISVCMKPLFGRFLTPWPTKATAAAVELSLSFPGANCTVAVQIWLSPSHWETNLASRLIDTLPGQATFVICARLQTLIHNWIWADPELYWFALTVLNAKHISYWWTSEHVLQYL